MSKGEQTELAVVSVDEQTQAVSSTSGTPQDLLRIAVEQGADVEKLERLMALQERWDASQARKAFFDALSRFQSDCPDILRTDKAHNSKYAKLAKIVKAVAPGLNECGLSYRFEIDDSGEKLAVTCVITHRAGHSERTSMSAAADTSGSKNAIQARASTVTYLQRYTLGGALGIVTMDEDNDGNTAPADGKTINAAQVKTIEGLLKELPPGNDKRMLKAYTISCIEELPESYFGEVIKTLNAKIEKLNAQLANA